MIGSQNATVMVKNCKGANSTMQIVSHIQCDSWSLHLNEQTHDVVQN